MNSLTQQMLNDFRRYIEPTKWADFEMRELADIAELGEIASILDVYSADGKELLERIYQRDYEVGTTSGSVLSSAVAGVDNLNSLLL
jgi:hypothetical protein